MNEDLTGARIAAARKEKGLTQNELARLMFIDKRTVNRWEHGELDSVKQFIELSKREHLDVPPAYLMGLTSTKDPNYEDAHDVTGLSEEALSVLQDNPDYMSINDYMIRNGYIDVLKEVETLHALEKYKVYKEHALSELNLPKDIKSVLDKVFFVGFSVLNDKQLLRDIAEQLCKYDSDYLENVISDCLLNEYEDSTDGINYMINNGMLDNPSHSVIKINNRYYRPGEEHTYINFDDLNIDILVNGEYETPVKSFNEKNIIASMAGVLFDFARPYYNTISLITAQKMVINQHFNNLIDDYINGTK